MRQRGEGMTTQQMEAVAEASLLLFRASFAINFVGKQMGEQTMGLSIGLALAQTREAVALLERVAIELLER